MLSRFFIDRPIFATVLSVVITFVGGIAWWTLPVSQYPRITPPGVSVAISYPGANAMTVAETVAAPIEQQVTGIPGMLYMSSQSGNDGSYSLSCTFEVGTNLNSALVMLQNRVTLAMPLLPTAVQQQGITIRKRTPDILMMVNFTSPDGRYDDVYLSNYVMINVRDELLRVDGVSDINIMGERDYSIRAWLDPQKLASRNMTATDVATAVRSQNIEAALGQIGQAPMGRTQAYQLPLQTLGRLSDPSQFGDIIVKIGENRPINSASTGSSSSRGLNTAATMQQSGSSSTSGSGSMTSMSPTPRSTTSSTGSDVQYTGAPTTSLYNADNSMVSEWLQPIGGPPTTLIIGGGTTDITQDSTSSSTTTGSTTSSSSAATTVTAPGSNLARMSMTGLTGSSNQNGVANRSLSTSEMGRGSRSPSASVVRLRDVARVEMGALNYNQAAYFDGLPSVGISVYQLPGTNALEVADRVRDKMKELSTRFPDGVKYTIGYDTTPFISESIGEVFKTLFEAILLVAIVVLFFLQDWKAMILPMIDVPVSLIGTFAVMAMLGYSLNNISLFGLVLAIGIVVDDAIVVLENIERQMSKGLEPREATLKAMDEITGPIIAITIVLCAVFIPCALISGITGRFFQQFAVTIAASTVISAINALTMTPSRALMILKKGGFGSGHGHKPEALPWWIFGLIGGWMSYHYGPIRFGHRFGLPIPGGENLPWPSWAVSLAWIAPGLLLGLIVGKIVIRPVNAILGWVFRGFNRMFDGMTAAYGWSIGKALRLSVIVLILYGGLLGLTWWMFRTAPTGFVPQQDMGRCLAGVQLADSSSLESTKNVMLQVEKIAREIPGVSHTIAICGTSFVQQANGPNFGSLFIILDPFEQRRRPGLKDEAIMAQLRKRWTKEVKNAQCVVFGSPPIPGISVAGGFKVIVEDRGGLGVDNLQTQTDRLIDKLRDEGSELRLMKSVKDLSELPNEGRNLVVLADIKGVLHFRVFDSDGTITADKDETGFPKQAEPIAELKKQLEKLWLPHKLTGTEKSRLITRLTPIIGQVGEENGLVNVSTQFRSGIPQLYLDVDRAKVAALGLASDEVNQALQIFLGSSYVNSFNEFGRHWQVTLQAEGKFRSQVEKVGLIQVRNKWGGMVPVGTVARMRETTGPIFINRYNLYTSAAVTGGLRPGANTGDIINTVDQSADEVLPRSMKADWTELMYLQIREGNTTPPQVVFSLSVLFVFLALAALYESWTLPLAVILVVPLCVLCALIGVRITGTSVNIFVQVGLVVLVGLACKNAILIVEFAREKHDAGMSIFEATQESSRLRLRPILMTSFAFILGVAPLVYATGAGAEMRRSLGTVVFSGMLGVTIFGVFLTPVFYYVIQGFGEEKLLNAPRKRLIFSCVLGVAVGVAGGYMLGRIGFIPRPWGMPAGGLAALLGVLAVQRRAFYPDAMTTGRRS